MRRLWLVAAIISGLAAPALAENRVALVIGNDDYERLPAAQQLHNAVNDARTMKATLEGLGFKVAIKENIRRADLIDALSDFAARIGKDDIAFFFYAGHGVSLNGANYILPSDIASARGTGREEEARLADNALSEARVTERMKSAGARVALVVLDACRDNPLVSGGGRSIGGTRGLSPPPETEGLMSIYSAGVGQSALDQLGDGDGNRNSVFTRVFSEVLKMPGLDLTGVARETRRRVSDLAKSAGQTQTPGYYDQIVGEVFLAGRGGIAALPNVMPPPVSHPPVFSLQPARLEEIARKFILNYLDLSNSAASADIEKFRETYANEVIYYGTKLPRERLLKQKSDFFSNWPDRKYLLRRNTISVRCFNETMICIVKGILDYKSINSAKQIKSSGSASFEFEILMSDQPQITKEFGTVLVKKIEREGILTK